MKTRRIRAAVLTLLCLALAGCRKDPEPTPTPEPSPVETGYRATGRGNPNVPPNEYDLESFVSVGGFTIYTAGGAASHIGVDVSAYQGEIDWVQVKEAGVEFAMVRAGFRGYGAAGPIRQDDFFQTNMEGALAAGLRVGVYFFSQATSEEEAAEEAAAVLEWIAPYDVTYPVVFDWESIPHAAARTDGVEPETVTQCVKTFCSAVEEAGYIPMVYFNRNHGYDVINLEQLSGCGFWLAGYNPAPSFDYAFDMWQYSCTGSVAGIAGDVDLNLCFVDYPVRGPDAGGEDEGEAA